MAGFDPNQPRDELGRWTEAGNSARIAAGLEGQWTDQSISFTEAGREAGLALGGRITIDREQYLKMDPQARKELLSHELAHNVVEDFVYTNPEEWNKATEALLLKSVERGNSMYFQYMFGQMDFGEAIATAISAYVNDLPDPMDSWSPLLGEKLWDKDRWLSMQKWAKTILQKAGYTKESFNRQIEFLRRQLEGEF